jgi:hypothetical protein
VCKDKCKGLLKRKGVQTTVIIFTLFIFLLYRMDLEKPDQNHVALLYTTAPGPEREPTEEEINSEKREKKV